MSDEQTNCTRCGARILALTAKENSGLCMPCARGEREHMDAGKREYLEDKVFRQSPGWQFWCRLQETPFKELSRPECQFYLVNQLRGSVISGGFQQFFYDEPLDRICTLAEALRVMGADRSLELLLEARAAYGMDDQQLIAYIWEPQQNPDIEAHVNSLNRRFWADPDNLWDCLQRFAHQHELFPQG